MSGSVHRKPSSFVETSKEPVVALILLTMNQREQTIRCLQSLAGLTGPAHRIVVWDNGSSDGTDLAVAERFPGVVVQRSGVNLGVASGRNAAVRLAEQHWSPRFYCFIDNDMTVEPDFLHFLTRPFDTDSRLALATGKIRCLGDEARLYGASGCVLDFRFGRTGHVGHGEIDKGQYDNRIDCLPSGGCMLVRADVFNQLSGFDSAFDPYGPEDLDFGLRVRRAGLAIRYVPDAVVYHEPSPGHTFGGGSGAVLHIRTKARLLFLLMRRHATWRQQAFFFLVGAPWTLGRMLAREVMRGNARAVVGLAGGVLDLLRSGRGSERTSVAVVDEVGTGKGSRHRGQLPPPR